MHNSGRPASSRTTPKTHPFASSPAALFPTAAPYSPRSPKSPSLYVIQSQTQKLIIAFVAYGKTFRTTLLGTRVIPLPRTHAAVATPNTTKVALDCDVLLSPVLLSAERTCCSLAGKFGDIDSIVEDGCDYESSYGLNSRRHRAWVWPAVFP